LAVCCSMLQYVAVCCSMLQYVAVCCSMMQYVAVCCSVCVVREEAIFVLTCGFIFTQIFHVFSEYFTASERVHESA